MNTRKTRGFSMMELVVVLAVIAILATLITPIITSYVDKAKLNKAVADVLSISTALNQFNSDTKNFPIFTAPAQYPNGSVYEVLASSGLDPALGSGITANWTTTNTGNLTQLLNENSLLITTSASSKAAWNGPYVGIIGEDPWGTKYIVTSRALKAGSGLTAFVLSAGPNRTVETALDQTRGSAFTIGGDDIVSIVR